MASLLASGCSVDEVERELIDFDFTDFLDIDEPTVKAKLIDAIGLHRVLRNRAKDKRFWVNIFVEA